MYEVLSYIAASVKCAKLIRVDSREVFKMPVFDEAAELDLGFDEDEDESEVSDEDEKDEPLPRPKFGVRDNRPSPEFHKREAIRRSGSTISDSGGTTNIGGSSARNVPGRAVEAPMLDAATNLPAAVQWRVWKNDNGRQFALGEIDIQCTETDFIRKFINSMPKDEDENCIYYLRPMDQNGRELGQNISYPISGQHEALVRFRRQKMGLPPNIYPATGMLPPAAYIGSAGGSDNRQVPAVANPVGTEFIGLLSKTIDTSNKNTAADRELIKQSLESAANEKARLSQEMVNTISNQTDNLLRFHQERSKEMADLERQRSDVVIGFMQKQANENMQTVQNFSQMQLDMMDRRRKDEEERAKIALEQERKMAEARLRETETLNKMRIDEERMRREDERKEADRKRKEELEERDRRIKEQEKEHEAKLKEIELRLKNEREEKERKDKLEREDRERKDKLEREEREKREADRLKYEEAREKERERKWKEEQEDRARKDKLEREDRERREKADKEERDAKLRREEQELKEKAEKLRYEHEQKMKMLEIELTAKAKHDEKMLELEKLKLSLSQKPTGDSLEDIAAKGLKYAKLFGIDPKGIVDRFMNPEVQSSTDWGPIIGQIVKTGGEAFKEVVKASAQMNTPPAPAADPVKIINVTTPQIQMKDDVPDFDDEDEDENRNTRVIVNRQTMPQQVQKNKPANKKKPQNDTSQPNQVNNQQNNQSTAANQQPVNQQNQPVNNTNNAANTNNKQEQPASTENQQPAPKTILNARSLANVRKELRNMVRRLNSNNKNAWPSIAMQSRIAEPAIETYIKDVGLDYAAKEAGASEQLIADFVQHMAPYADNSTD